MQILMIAENNLSLQGNDGISAEQKQRISVLMYKKKKFNEQRQKYLDNVPKQFTVTEPFTGCIVL